MIAIVGFALAAGNISDSGSKIKSKEEIKPQMPYRDLRIGNFAIDATSAISVAIDNNGKETILFEKDPDKQLLIASITKLMTAAVVLDNFNFSRKVKISKAGVRQGGILNAGDIFTVDTLFHIILIASDNTAAYTFSEMMPKGKFADLMNQKAKEFGLANTYYGNSVGYGLENHSTANDLAKLSYQLLKKYPFIFQTSATDEYDIRDVEGRFDYKTKNADKLLANELLDYEDRIIGAKMGENEKAGGCLVLVLKAPNNDGYIINVILDSTYRFTEMTKLVNWIDTAYKWE